MLDPISRLPESPGEPSATQQAYGAIRKLILTGALAPGEKLKIDRLRTLVNAGASPVREALSLLTSDLLVERIDQRGFRTAAVSGANFDEILTLRCHLEEMALRDSIANATPAWEETLVLAHHKLSKESRENVDAFETVHKDFHMALLAASPSKILLRFCSQLYDLNIRYRYIAGRALNYGARDVTREHRAILDAAVALDADAASDRLLKHYKQTGAYLADLMSRA